MENVDFQFLRHRNIELPWSSTGDPASGDEILVVEFLSRVRLTSGTGPRPLEVESVVRGRTGQSREETNGDPNAWARNAGRKRNVEGTG